MVDANLTVFEERDPGKMNAVEPVADVTGDMEEATLTMEC